MALNPAPQRQNVSTFVSPLIGDILFSETVDTTRLGEPNFPEYGTPHPDYRKWPDHKLVFIRAVENARDSIYEFFYAADREDQDKYNWEISAGEQLTRTYFIRRELYDTEEFPILAAATLDTQFPQYGFADDTISEAPKELASLYVVVRRRFVEPVVSEIIWQNDFQRYIRVTKEIIAPQVTPTAPTITVGSQVEIRQGNRYHDVRVTQELLGGTETYQKPTILDYRNFNFPSRLDSIELVYAYAWAVSVRDAPSYSEDFFFRYNITEPRSAPYDATLLRFVTSDPESIKAANPLTPIPAPIRETLAIVYSWATAGIANRTQAVAREQQLPPTIHREITITVDGEEIPEDAEISKKMTTTFAETKGYSEFVALSEITVGYEVRELPFQMFEVSVIKLNIANLYGEPSADSTLRGLVLSAGTLAPAFTPATTSYTASVSNATASITVTPTTSDPYASITVNGSPVTSGTSSLPISLSVGANVITIAVTSEDTEVTTTYTVTVTRAP